MRSEPSPTPLPRPHRPFPFSPPCRLGASSQLSRGEAKRRIEKRSGAKRSEAKGRRLLPSPLSLLPGWRPGGGRLCLPRGAPERCAR